MKLNMSAFLALTLALTANAAFAASLTVEQRAADFDALRALFDTQYGMVEVKKNLLGVDFDTVWDNHRYRAIHAKNDQAFLAELAYTVGDFHDAHIALVRPSDQRAFLGFRVDQFGDQAIVTEIDRDVLSKELFPMSVGDELLTMDGVPVQKLAKDLAHLRQGANPASDLGLAYIILTRRSGRFFPVPQKDVALKFKKVDGSLAELSLPWIQKGKPLGSASFMGSFLGNRNKGPLELRASWIDLDGTLTSASSQSIRFELPVPPHAVVLSTTPTAYVIDSPKKPVGYVRLDTFSPENKMMAMMAYQEIFQKMETLTGGMIIDMRGNGGGSIMYGFSLASMLIDHPIQAESIAWRVTPTRILEFRQEVDTTSNPAEKQSMKNILDVMESAYSRGETMTSFMPLLVGNTLMPHAEIHYTHPVVLLVDDQCYSMCDFFSALLQDAKRAKVVGVPTVAAGGPVEEFGALPYSGVIPHLTVGVGQRANGTLIENSPVQPDIHLEIKASDVAHEYSEFRNAFWQVLLEDMAAKQKEKMKRFH